MKQVMCAMALLATPALTAGLMPKAALAQENSPGQSQRAAQDSIWLQIEAQPSLDIAQERARAYAALFPDVAGFDTRGWFAIALGPYADRAAAEARLRQLKDEGLIPGDSFIAFGRDYREAFWPDAAALPTAPAAEPAPAPVEDPLLALPSEPAAEPAPEQLPAQLPEAVAEPAPPAFVEETPAEARASEAALDQAAREKLQTALQWFGFYDARVDGAFGPGTRKSMAAWQEANGLEPTGTLTTMQRETLVAAYDQAQAELGLATSPRFTASMTCCKRWKSCRSRANAPARNAASPLMAAPRNWPAMPMPNCRKVW